MQDSSLFYFDTARAAPGTASYLVPPNPTELQDHEYYYPDPGYNYYYPQQSYQQANQAAYGQYQQPNLTQQQQQQQQQSYVQTQPVLYYVRPEYATQPNITYTYDPITGLCSYDPQQMAASLNASTKSAKRKSEAQAVKPARKQKRQKQSATLAPGVEVIDLENYYASVHGDTSPASPQANNYARPYPVTAADSNSHARVSSQPQSAFVIPASKLSSEESSRAAKALSRAGAIKRADSKLALEENLRPVKAVSGAGALTHDTSLPSPPLYQQAADEKTLNHPAIMSSRRDVLSDPARHYVTPAPSSPGMPDPSMDSAARSVIVPVQTGDPDTSLNAPLPSYIPLEDSQPMPSQFKEASGGTPVAESLSGEREPPLCAEQQELVDLILSGRNVFYTGSAGCGKSTVLKAFTKRLRDMGKKVNIIAPTGRAALQVNGSTTWTYAGWTPDSHKRTLDELRQQAHGKMVWKRLTSTDVLVIDEISMVENLHLERLNQVMKAARFHPNRPDLAFGGVQVILTGDFCQLPPVKPFQYCIDCGSTLIEGTSPTGKIYTCRKHGLYRDEDKWAFRSKAWEECNFVHFELKQVHRQSDKLFISMLQKCRRGLRLSEEDINILMNHKVNGVKNATQLHAVRYEVEKVNRAQFQRLKTVCHTFHSLDSFNWRGHSGLQYKGTPKPRTRDSRWPDSLTPLKSLDDHRFDQCVELKQGMLVVLLVNLNLEAGLCNGSQGTICGWEAYDPKKLPKAAKNDKSADQEPGWRITGDRAEMKEEMIRQFIDAQPTDYRVVDGQRVESKKVWPKVRFHNGEARTIYAECSISELGDEKPYSLLARTQIPLAPAWAMTIHKAQGMTLDKVVVNLSRAFEEGQVYVALSRARALEGLKIEGDSAGLRVGLGGNKEVQRFFREKFGGGEVKAEDDDDDEEEEEGEGILTPSSSGSAAGSSCSG